MPTVVFRSNGLRVHKISQIKYIINIYILIMSSWKTLGGIDKFDKTNHITVNSLVANYFVVKKSIVGDIDISGNISVGKYLYVDKDARARSARAGPHLDVDDALQQANPDVQNVTSTTLRVGNQECIDGGCPCKSQETNRRVLVSHRLLEVKTRSSSPDLKPPLRLPLRVNK